MSKNLKVTSLRIDGNGRATRIPCEIPATLGSSTGEPPFSQPCLVILASPYVCAVRFGRDVAIGTGVWLRGLPGAPLVTAKVVNCIQIGVDRTLWLLGLTLDEPRNVWGIQSPPKDWAR